MSKKPLIIHFLMRISKKENSLSNSNTWHSNAHGSMSTPHLILVFLLNLKKEKKEKELYIKLRTNYQRERKIRKYKSCYELMIARWC